MSTVRRKEVSKTHLPIPRKSYQNFEILKPQQIAGVKGTEICLINRPGVEEVLRLR